jgi:hypothetical protein
VDEVPHGAIDGESWEEDGLGPTEGRLLLLESEGWWSTRSGSSQQACFCLVLSSSRSRVITSIVGAGVDLGNGIMGVDALSLESLTCTTVWFSALYIHDYVSDDVTENFDTNETRSVVVVVEQNSRHTCAFVGDSRDRLGSSRGPSLSVERHRCYCSRERESESRESRS